ncbi:MAG: DNA topoisomerase VI subunit B [Candidatus Aenigmarchaeota archaeon]|nr:DNA topoisomerase VI subunit B [Candidatus Aenigmarchaeota archaeon]
MADLIKKSAEEFAKEQKEISISEFFEKNKHLLGFDNPTKALLMTVKEAVDNSLDACEEAGVLPDITVKIKQTGEDRFRVIIQDNGPGIVKEQVPRIFGKLLYGSKFHRLRQSRGQQGIGISAVVLYSQLTTGSPTKVWSRTDEKKKVHYYELFINTSKNEPEIVKEEALDEGMERGVKVEIDVVGRYRKTQGVDDYMKQTSIANPFAKMIYHAPDGTKMTFPRSFDALPKPPKEMRMHPYGVEFGILQRFLTKTNSKTLLSFLTNEFSSVGTQTAKEICKTARLDANAKPSSLDRAAAEKLLGAMQKVKIQRPPTDCLSPIGEQELEKSLKKEYPQAEFVSVIEREPEVYGGMPFQIEVGVVFGNVGGLEEPIDFARIANRVPLLYQAGACATMEAVKEVDWKRYGLQQPKNSLPVGPMILVIHMTSVWVPFVSESKEAIAPYPEIVKEMKLAVQDAARELSRYLSGKRRAGEAKRRIQIFERYAKEVASSLSVITGEKENAIEKKLLGIIENKNKMKDFEQQEAVQPPQFAAAATAGKEKKEKPRQTEEE